MSADKHQAAVKVYQLKVSLRGISPMIWRRLLVTSHTTVAHLHNILQIAMSWEDLHLHQFRVHGKEYGIYCEGRMFFDDDPYQVTLADFQLRASEQFVYEYDMGDFWQHDIRLERVLPLDLSKTYDFFLLSGGTASLTLAAAVKIAVTAILTAALVAPLAWVASAGRGYMPPIGVLFLLLVLAQIVAAAGWGGVFPWSVPALASGITGPGAPPVGLVSYLLVILTGVIGIAGTLAWWRWADQT